MIKQRKIGQYGVQLNRRECNIIFNYFLTRNVERSSAQIENKNNLSRSESRE